MKFWLTVVVGVIVLAAGSTAMVVLNPQLQREETSVADANEDPTKKGDQPMAVPEGDMSVDLGTVAQHTKGQNIFKIRNKGKADLVLEAKKPSCTCTDLFLWNAPYKAEDAVPASKPQAIKLKPNELAYIIARWDTKEKSGAQGVALPIVTTDPNKRDITFALKLEIVQEVGITASSVEFGQISEGQKTTRFVDFYSPVRDKVELVNLKPSAPFLKVRTEPLSKEAVARLQAKSGARLFIETTGAQPMGAFAEAIEVTAKTGANGEPQMVPVVGSVIGDFELIPLDRFDFKEVTPGSHAPISTRIFARKLKDGEELRLGKFKPAFLDVKLVRQNPKFKVWTLTAEVKPGAPAGQFSGNIEVLDPAGQVRIVVRAGGIIDAAWSEATAAR